MSSFFLELVGFFFKTFWPLPLFEVGQEVSDSDYPPGPKQGGAACAGEPPQPWAATHKGPPPELSGQTGREGASPPHQLGQKCPRWAKRSLGNKSRLRTMHDIVLSFYARNLIIHHQEYLKFFDGLRVKKVNFISWIKKCIFNADQGYTLMFLYPYFGERPCTMHYWKRSLMNSYRVKKLKVYVCST